MRFIRCSLVVILVTLVGETFIEGHSMSVKKSTCQAAFKACEQDESCRWHLSELQIRCATQQSPSVPGTNPSSCRRDQCGKALVRFTRYVSLLDHVEPMIFCKCDASDSDCTHLQRQMYPKCLYFPTGQPSPPPTCSHVVKLCQSEPLCHRHLNVFNRSCQAKALVGLTAISALGDGTCLVDESNSTSLRKCREAVVSIRGTHLEAPCYCNTADAACLKNRLLTLANNPCVDVVARLYRAAEKYATQPPLIATLATMGKRNNEPAAGSNRSRTKFPTTTTHAPATLSSSPIFPPTPTAKPLHPHSTTTTTITSLYTIEEAYPIGSGEDEGGENIDLVGSSSEKRGPPSSTTQRPTADPLLHKKRKHFRINSLPTGDYIAQPSPPSEGGCSTRNVEGEWIHHYKESIFRVLRTLWIGVPRLAPPMLQQYHDWSGRCSSWCECNGNETTCHNLTCLSDAVCEARHTTVGFGEKLYLERRGACQCQSGRFICEHASDFNGNGDLPPGLYITLGYSKEEILEMKDKVPAAKLESAGLVSPDRSLAKDISSRLQFALERVLPEGTLCRIAVLEHIPKESVLVLQVQWYGVDRHANETLPRWHVGKMEKLCSPHVGEVEYMFLLERAERYQLLLSTVKQLKVLDLLDGLPEMPASTGEISKMLSPFVVCCYSLVSILASYIACRV